MHWFSRFLVSSLGQKLIMSLTGIFLILFLIVHLGGNLLLLVNDDGELFNRYSYFMTHNIVIELIAYLLYIFIVLHAIQGIVLARYIRKSRPNKYKVNTYPKANTAAKRMFILGLLILAFLLLHMGDFWVKMKWGQLPTVQYAGMDHEIYNLFWRVNIAFQQPWIVIVYLLGVLALAFHLWHGFQSAFQTLGINHKKYTPLIRGIGKAYSIIIPLGFAILPVYYYFFRQLME